MTLRQFEIRQEPGPAARARAGRYGLARTKRLGSGRATDERAALTGFILNRYPPGHAQYVGHRFEWMSEAAYYGASPERWHADDGRIVRGRRWRAVVTLRNGRRSVHDIFLQAWRSE